MDEMMLRKLLAFFGFRVVYTCEWGAYNFRYDDKDRMAGRPIHPDMSVAPPWAKARIVRL